MKTFKRVHIDFSQTKTKHAIKFLFLITCSMPFLLCLFIDWNIPYMPNISPEEMNPYSYKKVMNVIEDGDILITFDSHFLNWRNGHAAIVVDAENGLVLEARTLGVNSSLSSIHRWSTYNSFAILRLADLTADKRSEIALFAHNRLTNVPYSLLPRFIKFPIEDDAVLSGTHCSHLIWLSFMQYGYDLDSDGGLIVTPRDLYDSMYLEKVGIYVVE